MNARQLQPGVRYRLPAKSQRGDVVIDVPAARFVRRIWSVAQDEHWFLFLAGTGREVWLPCEDIASCEVEEEQRG